MWNWLITPFNRPAFKFFSQSGKLLLPHWALLCFIIDFWSERVKDIVVFSSPAILQMKDRILFDNSLAGCRWYLESRIWGISNLKCSNVCYQESRYPCSCSPQPWLFIQARPVLQFSVHSPISLTYDNMTSPHSLRCSNLLCFTLIVKWSEQFQESLIWSACPQTQYISPRLGQGMMLDAGIGSDGMDQGIFDPERGSHFIARAGN